MMLAAGMIVTWLGYAVGSWGYILVRGWDIPFRAWVSPLNPYQWPTGGPPPIPDTNLTPGLTGGAGAPAAANPPGAGTSAPGTPPLGFGQGGPEFVSPGAGGNCPPGYTWYNGRCVHIVSGQVAG